MTTYAKIKTNAVVFNPTTDIADPNSLYVDPAIGNKLVTNDPSSVRAEVLTGTTTESAFIKQMQAFDAIRAGKPVSKRSDGKIIEADSDGTSGTQQPIGISIDPMTADGLGRVVLFGYNVENALTGLGFTPGDEIYIGEVPGGYTNDITSLTGENDSLVKVGVADCAAGVASAEAVDLIIYPQVIARP